MCDAPYFVLGKGAYPQVVASSDGSWLAVTSTRLGTASPPRARDITVRIFSSLTFNQIARFHPAVPVYVFGITPDGSRIYGMRPSKDGQPSDLSYALNARTGAVESKTKLAGGCSPWLIDYSTQRMYSLETHDAATHTPDLIACDLRTGSVIHRETLGGIRFGTWQTDRQINNEPVIASWSPGFALSPDGRSLAVLDGSADTLTVLDAATGRVTRVETLSRPQSLPGRIAGWLGVIPAAASAKEMEGVELSMRFSPDRRSLYVTGWRGTVGADGAWTQVGLGLRRIDVASGAVDAQALGSANLWWVDLSRDGKALYTLEEGHTQSGRYTLRRHDATSLQVTAQRELSNTSESMPQIFVLPAVSL